MERAACTYPETYKVYKLCNNGSHGELINFVNISINSFPTSGDFCRLLITFANGLEPDQARHFYMDSNCLTLWWYSWKMFLKKIILKENPQMTKKHTKLHSMQRVKGQESWCILICFYLHIKTLLFSYYSTKTNILRLHYCHLRASFF